MREETMSKAQKITSPNGEEMVPMLVAEYELLIEAPKICGTARLLSARAVGSRPAWRSY